MTGIRQRFFGLCLPPLLFASLDYLLTLFGQPAEYWAGQYSRSNEASPFLAYLLDLHPLAFVAGVFCIVSCLVLFILVLPDTLALFACMAGSLSSVIGASTWLLRRTNGYQLVSVFALTSALVLALCLRWGWKARPDPEYRLGISLVLRWICALLLLALYVYVQFFWPF